MKNNEIIKQLKLSAALMELHQDPAKSEEAFRIKGYNNAIFNIERLDQPLSKLSHEEICKIDGIGKSIASVIFEIINSGTSAFLVDLTQKTPLGILEMLKLKGIGPKKIRMIWDELKIETAPELLQACEEGRVRKLKGFGEKTEENIRQALIYIASNKGKMLYYGAEKIASLLEEELVALFPEALISIAGELRRKLEIIDKIDFVVANENIPDTVERLNFLNTIKQDLKNSSPFTWRGHLSDESLKVEINLTDKSKFFNLLFLHTGAPAHLVHVLENNKTLLQLIKEKTFSSEESIYQEAQLPFLVPELREGLFEFNENVQGSLQDLLKVEDLKGVIHSHSTYSDGKNTLRQMAEQCIKMGYGYLGITDHSKTAFYANGLDEFRILQQHLEIDALNKELVPFKIFKGIESDILNDGSLDYSDEVLGMFDFIIASVHSNLNMDMSKATERLLKAVSNPYTTFLGHATARLLLRREGYPIDHKAVIDACAAHGVIIEINANPHRLDMDWRWVQYAIEKGVRFSINPDAHEVETIQNMYYGVCVARKGGLTKKDNFNCLSGEEVSSYFSMRKKTIKV
ncbi:MAG: DNA polymerase/3'-5' exonuclease PolX [Bacteroidota bacterium]|nr:DNA polymerase/3'-5' exonuclease PolX [Bacteroidota bacterium]